MVNSNSCCCENCGRTNKSVQINPLTIDHHTSYLCLLCEHVLNTPENQNRFFSLVLSRKSKHANPEMQRAHRIVSAFIAVGVLFLVAITALGAAQNYDITTLPLLETEAVLKSEHLSFLQLKSFN